MTMKKMISLALATCMALALAAPVAAATVPKQEEVALINTTVESVDKEYENAGLQDIGTATIKDAVVINGKTNYLYPTFDDVDSALKNLKEEIPAYYDLVTQKVDLKEAYNYSYDELMDTEFDVDIAEAVKNEVMLMSSDNQQALTSEETEKLREEKDTFNNFFDIYENRAQNEAIKQYLEKEENPDPAELAAMLPYTAPFSIEYYATAEPMAAAAQHFDKDKGIEYAKKWATGYNANYPAYILQGDCTNFASQILVAGGIKMHDAYPDEEKGWWHRVVNDLGTVNPGPRHVTSSSWKGAHRFAKFMGTSNISVDFAAFSKLVQRGDFIALDEKGDGDWNHLGFVTDVGQTGKYSYKYGGKTYQRTYRTFCVAQHTSNYHAWVHSDTNNWEWQDANGNKAKFAVVRRQA